MRSYPLSFVLGGNYDWSNGRVWNQGYRNHTWSATVVSMVNVNYFRLDPSLVNTSETTGSKRHGFSIRESLNCLALLLESLY